MMTAEQLKSSILQLAMQGKLVSQNPDDEPASVLLKKISEEKNRLIKEGKIKKQKPLPEIKEEEKPFDIPESWGWVRFGNIFDIGSAIRIHQSDWKNEGIPFFRGRELVRLARTGDPDAEIFISKELYEKNKVKGGVPQKNDLLISAVGTIGKVYIVQGTKPFYYKDAYILRFNNYSHLYSEYFKFVIESPFAQSFIAKGCMGTTVAQLTILKAKNMVCPLPPLEEQKRIVAKIEELMPFVEQYAAASTKLNTLNTSFPDLMKKSILQEAMQGKLVPQDPNDEPASVLLKKISEEKNRLIKEGKIKKQKPLPEIKEEDIPFDIPQSWKWVRLRNVVYDRGQVVPSSKFSYIDIGSIDNKRQCLSNEENLIEADKAPSRARKIVEKGDIIYSTVRPYLHNMAIIDRDFSCPPIASTGFATMVCYEGVYNKFLFNYLLSPSFDNYANAIDNSKGVAYPAINDEKLYKAIVPLPPLEEQKRIVAKIEELMAVIDNLSS